ncbi:MAG: glycosyltransferase [Desulfuromonadales bacterium]|nr:MAG: glycosyltransferase [Desulfuromonadales bacterium]
MNNIVSVILPVYNGSQYLREAIDSILAQSYLDFEFLIIDDGSTDDSSVIISSYTDPRIRFFSQKNRGLASTLNRGIALASGAYIARQDQDDVSLPERLARQLAFLAANPDYGMVGTWATIWEGATPTERSHRHSTENLKLKFDLLFDNPFVHSSMMIRKSVFESVGGYSTDRDRQPPEDYELWSRVARCNRVGNVPEILHVYREMPGSMSRDGDNPFLNHLLAINVENLSLATSGAFSEQSLLDLAALAHGAYQKCSGNTHLCELESIVRHAAEGTCTANGEGSGLLQQEVNYRLNSIRYHYYQFKYAGVLGNSGRAFIGRLARKLKNLVR